MRKSLVFIAILLALSVGLICYAYDLVDGGKDRVSFEETVLFGDKAAAEGIAITSEVQCNDRMFWDTRYIVGETPTINTEFTFSQFEKSRLINQPPVNINFESVIAAGGYSSSGSVDLRSDPIMLDVASRTAPGEEHNETVFVKDYYDCYPFNVFSRHILLGNIDNEQAQAFFQDYFKIPVLPEHRLEIGITKDEAGNIRSVNMSQTDDVGLLFESVSTLTENHCLFVFSPRRIDNTENKLTDTSGFKGGYGIYRFPLLKTDGDNDVSPVPELEMVYPVDAETAEVYALETSGDKETLFLVTLENGSFMLSVIDVESMALLQKLEILKAGDAGFSGIEIYDDFVVPIAGDGQFAVLEKEPDGLFAICFASTFGEDEKLWYVFSRDVSMDFDGEKLAVAAYREGMFDQRQRFCTMLLSVYDKTGLRFIGEYTQSLDKAPIEYRLSCQPDVDVPLSVAIRN